MSGEWEPQLLEGQEPIERFGSSKVQSIAASIAGMRAVNFASADVDEAAAGFGTPTATVTLSLAPERDEDAEEDAEETPVDPSTFEDIVLHVGGESGSNNEWYVRHVGNPVIYVISTYLADRMRAGTEQFQNRSPVANLLNPQVECLGCQVECPGCLAECLAECLVAPVECPVASRSLPS